MRLDDLNVLTAETAAAEFRRCCGSTRWARLMAAARPFASVEAMSADADTIWHGLGPADWREAFAAHPRIGTTVAGRAGRAGGAHWSDDEQSGVRTASLAVRERLAKANRDYEARFGYIFIVCATGKSAEEMLAMLERRLRNGPGEELPIAAEEQRKITRLRLAKLVEGA